MVTGNRGHRFNLRLQHDVDTAKVEKDLPRFRLSDELGQCVKQTPSIFQFI